MRLRWWKKRPPGKWIYGPMIGGRRPHQNRFWATLEEAKKYENPQPPLGRGGVHRPKRGIAILWGR